MKESIDEQKRNKLLLTVREICVKHSLGGDMMFAAFVCALSVAISLSVLLVDEPFVNLEFVNALNHSAFFGIVLVAFAALLSSSIYFRSKIIIPRALMLSVLALGVALAREHRTDIYFCAGVSLVIGLTAYWLCRDDKMGLLPLKINRKFAFRTAVALFMIFFVAISWFTILRYASYGSSTYDFGIFAQMFEQMRKTGLPMTTLERDMRLSHFGVHFSPVFYLLLPFYMLYPHPGTLLVMQAAAIGAGVFAIYAICKELDISPKLTIGIMVIYTFFPSMAGGAFYDFHENKFLTVPLLWLVYFILKRRMPLIILFSVLVMMVKEDAPIYVMALSAYMVICRKQYAAGVAIGVLAAVYFVLAVNIVNGIAEAAGLGGVMVSRLGSYWPPGEEQNFLTVAKTCFYNLPYVVAQIFKQERFEFMLWAFLPVLFTPFLTKQLSTLILLVPMMVVNLMPDWQYQYNIAYQYTYGSLALVIVLMILAICGMKPKTRRAVVLSGAAISIVLCASLNLSRMESYYKGYYSNVERVDSVNGCLERIPRDASITATTFFTPHLYQFDEVYMANSYYRQRGDVRETDYFVLSNNAGSEENELLQLYIELGYELVDSGAFVEVYKKPA